MTLPLICIVHTFQLSYLLQHYDLQLGGSGALLRWLHGSMCGVEVCPNKHLRLMDRSRPGYPPYHTALPPPTTTWFSIG